ncbi:MAG: sulfotransferase [Fimbriimonas sp.]|nr:sulfotransferase [Fimbriimonas sp.]
MNRQPDPRVQRWLAEAWKANQEGRLEDADGLLVRALSLNPNDLRTLLASATVAYRMGRAETAMERIQRILAIEPNLPPALNWMTVLLLEQGRAEEARPYAERSTRADPKNEESFSLLGRCLLELRRNDEALVQFDRGLAIRPSDASLHYGRAAALERLNRPSDAEMSWRAAVSIAPEPDGLLKVAEFDRGLGKVEDAIKACRRAIGKSPDHLGAHRLLARILTEEGRMDEATPYWERSLHLGGDPTEVTVSHAYALLTAGQFDKGISEFRRAIETAPSRWEPFQGIVSAKRFSEDDLPLLAQMKAVADDQNASIDAKINLNYSLGKAFDNLGSYHDAIDRFDLANRLKYEQAGLANTFDADALHQETKDKIRTFTSVHASGTDGERHPSDTPIFVLGMMRSGTTLVEQILTCHPEVGGSGEQPFWREWEPVLADWKAGKLHLDRARDLSERYVRTLKTIAPGKRFIVDKNPANCMIAGLLHLVYPDAKIIHTIRHPVDTALSIWMTPMQTVAPFVCNRTHIVLAYRQYRELAELWRRFIPADRYMEVSYEDIVQDREKSTRALIAFCGLDWDERCMHPEQNLRAVKTPSFWQVRQPIYTSSLERWRRYEPWLGEFRELMH